MSYKRRKQTFSSIIHVPDEIITQDVMNRYKRLQKNLNYTFIFTNATFLHDDAFSTVHLYITHLSFPELLVLDEFISNKFRFHNIRFSLTSFTCAKLKIIPPGLFGDGGDGYILNSISFPEAIVIHDYAFAFNQLKFIEIPKVEVIGEAAFFECDIERLELLKIRRIEEDAFSFSKKLTSVTLGSKLEYIGHNSFNCCEKLFEFIIKSPVQPKLKIEQNFALDSDLVQAVYIDRIQSRPGTINGRSYPKSSGNVMIDSLNTYLRIKFDKKLLVKSRSYDPVDMYNINNYMKTDQHSHLLDLPGDLKNVIKSFIYPVYRENDMNKEQEDSYNTLKAFSFL